MGEIKVGGYFLEKVSGIKREEWRLKNSQFACSRPLSPEWTVGRKIAYFTTFPNAAFATGSKPRERKNSWYSSAV